MNDDGLTPDNPFFWPLIWSHEVDAVADWLEGKRGPYQRKPMLTARLLVLVVKLWKEDRPLPTHAAVADYCGCSPALVDTFLSQREDEKVIKIIHARLPGRIKQRASTVTIRFVRPCPELIAAVERAGPP